MASKPAFKGDDVTCADFSSSAEATVYMKANGVQKLDRDGDGIACESLESGEAEYPEWEPTSKPPEYHPGEPEEPEYEEPEHPEYEEPEQPEYPDSEVPSSTKPPEYRP